LKSSLFRLSLLFIIFSLTILLFSSCKKDPYEIGYDLLPGNDTLNIGRNDSTSIIAYSELQDSIRSDETSTFPLGSIMDPVYGITTASVYSQFQLATTPFSFGKGAFLDSVVLMLQYSSIYGDTNKLQSLKVYEVNEILDKSKTYYSNQSAEIFPTLLANKTFRPAINDSVSVYGKKVAPHLRINLNQFTNYFGNKIISASTASLDNVTSFSEYMRGLYIESEKVNYSGAMVSINPYGTETKLVVYYHNQDEGDSLHCDMAIYSTSARFSHLDHNNYSDASPDFKSQVLNHDTTLGRNQLFLQGLGGVRTKIRLPFLKDFVKKNPKTGDSIIVVNSALLVLKNITTDTTLAPPLSLTLMKIDSAGYTSFLIDENEGAEYFGGTYNKTARTYSFRITRYVQSILLGKSKNLDLYVMVNNPIKSLLIPSRVVLNGTNPTQALSSDRIQFQMIYTRSR
jgi:hypothetical protein